MGTITETTIFEIIDCPFCGCQFAMTQSMCSALQDTHDAFYCPRKCCLSWPQESDVEKLRKDLALQKGLTRTREAQLTSERQAHRKTEQRRRAQKANVTKLKNRSAAGLCPYCSRSFKQLKRHMDSKHPDYAE